MYVYMHQFVADLDAEAKLQIAKDAVSASQARATEIETNEPGTTVKKTALSIAFDGWMSLPQNNRSVLTSVKEEAFESLVIMDVLSREVFQRKADTVHVHPYSVMRLKNDGQHEKLRTWEDQVDATEDAKALCAEGRVAGTIGYGVIDGNDDWVIKLDFNAKEVQ